MTKIVIALLLGWGIFLGCEDENIVSEPSYYAATNDDDVIEIVGLSHENSLTYTGSPL